MNGKARIICADGTVCEGEFIDGFLEGFGIQRFADGFKYEGNYKMGKPNGQGV